MIYFVLHEYHRYAVANFIDAWGRDVKPKIKILTHQDLRYATRLARGTYVFGDADRLTPDERALSSSVADTLITAGCRVLNHPTKVIWRRELARRLEADGINCYRCWRADEDWSSVKFPAFVRREDDHGSLKRELLHDADAIRKGIATSGAPAHETLVTEYIDTRGRDGLFRKYSAIRIGGAPFPRHLLFSKDWIVKYADLVDAHLIEEEERYFDGFGGDLSHEAQVARVFELADVEYGRIDYSIAPNGRIQVWEINLSPNLGSPPNKIALTRIVSQVRIGANIVSAIAALDPADQHDPSPVWLNHDPAMLKKLGVGSSVELLRAGGKIAGRVLRLPGVRRVAALAQWASWLAVQ
jgi:hypothetical protein